MYFYLLYPFFWTSVVHLGIRFKFSFVYKRWIFLPNLLTMCSSQEYGFCGSPTFPGHFFLPPGAIISLSRCDDWRCWSRSVWTNLILKPTRELVFLILDAACCQQDQLIYKSKQFYHVFFNISGMTLCFYSHRCSIRCFLSYLVHLFNRLEKMLVIITQSLRQYWYPEIMFF